VDEQPLILVVEDDDATPSFLLDNLAADGFRVAGASGAGEALRAIEVRQPALVVLDFALDDGSGLAPLDRVRATDGLSSRIDPDLPVIVVSGRAGDADRVRSFARGADDRAPRPPSRRGRTASSGPPLGRGPPHPGWCRRSRSHSHPSLGQATVVPLTLTSKGIISVCYRELSISTRGTGRQVETSHPPLLRPLLLPTTGASSSGRT
jgi:CheY-like chemotaxis protein